MAIKKELLDDLLKDRDPKTMFSAQGVLGDLKKALAERVLNAEKWAAAKAQFAVLFGDRLEVNR